MDLKQSDNGLKGNFSQTKYLWADHDTDIEQSADGLKRNSVRYFFISTMVIYFGITVQQKVVISSFNDVFDHSSTIVRNNEKLRIPIVSFCVDTFSSNHEPRGFCLFG